LVLDHAATGVPTVADRLGSAGYPVVTVASDIEALEILRGEHPALLVVAPGGGGSEHSWGGLAHLRATAREMGIPVLAVMQEVPQSEGRLGTLEDADDWLVRDGSSQEFKARVARLLRRNAAGPIDPSFSSMIVHDLRTPLNVIGLSVRMLEQVLPRDDPEINEDVRFIDENLRQIERMLSQLGDYARLFDPALELNVSAFDPRRLVDELLESRTGRPGSKGSTVRLQIDKTCPEEATLDQGRARMAIDYALINANTAAQSEPIRLTLRGLGNPQRWVIEVAIDRSPPPSIGSAELRPHAFGRLCGCAEERQGMDLAIAARISELFGGSARLEVVAGRGTAIILDWPAQFVGATTNGRA